MTAKAAKAPTKKTKTTKVKTVTASARKSKAVETAQPKLTQQPAEKKKGGQQNNLRAWNLRLGLLLVAEAVAVVVAGTSKTVELTHQYLTKDVLATEAAGKGADVLATATRHLAGIRLSWIVAGVLLLFAAVYLLTATVWRRNYEEWLSKGVNRLRWVAFGLGGGAIMATVAMLSGVSDSTTLSLLFGSVVLAATFAAAAELLGPGRRLRTLLGVGALVGAFLPWLVIICTVSSVLMYNGDLPSYLYYVYVTVTLLLVAVGLGLYFRLKQRGKWSDTLYTEKMFIGLGFAAATLVALQIFAGALQP